MRMLWLLSLQFAALTLVTGGCASFDGSLVWLDTKLSIFDPGIGGPASVDTARVDVFFDKPEVVDNDAEKDFTPLAEVFSESLRRVTAEYFCKRGAFRHCLANKTVGIYRMATRVVVADYRQAHGGMTTLILGGLFPPLIGLGWSVPVGMGTCNMSIEWTLQDPSGKQVWNAVENVADGLGQCRLPGGIGMNHLTHRLREAVERALVPASLAARKADALASPALAVSATTPVPAKPVAPEEKKHAPRVVLAVFDVQDASGRFQDSVLVQLTSFLSTAMTTTGRFTTVPREQLRARLVDEKVKTYRTCYDISCQIELGKAVAAQKTLSTQLLQVGQRCAVVANLYDLKTETSVGAATVKTGCADNELLDAMSQVATQINQAEH